jgi:KDO2-lipid IV(A) lauroyltransferase
MAINCLEMPKLARETNFSNVVSCDNPETAEKLFKEGKGIVFFCGHQSNWDVLFLDGNLRMKGIAIGKAIKNPFLYDWIVRIREKTGGKIIAPRQAIKEGLRALRKGVFVGIVGDQGMPDSGYSYPFFGRTAWNSTAPALLAYRTGSPILVATTRRVKGGYKTHYSTPIWPNTTAPKDAEVKRLMDESLYLLQESIRRSPGEWLWQHNRWKQQTPDRVYRPFRKDCICIILPKEKETWKQVRPHLEVFRKIYPTEHLTVMVFHKYRNEISLKASEVLEYKTPQETLKDDYRFKLVFNLSSLKQVKKHYLNKSAQGVYSIEDLKKICGKPSYSLSKTLLDCILRSE